MTAHLAPPPPRMFPMFWSRFCGWALEWAVATSSSSSMEEGDMVRRGASEEWRHPVLDTLYTAETYSHTGKTMSSEKQIMTAAHLPSCSVIIITTIISTVINQFKTEIKKSVNEKCKIDII